MKKMKAPISTKTKFSPLTISLFVVLALYVVFLVVMFLWAFLTASKGYYTDYFSFEPSKVPHNIVGLPKEFVLFQNLAEINDGFSDYTLENMALNTILYAVGYSLSKVVVTISSVSLLNSSCIFLTSLVSVRSAIPVISLTLAFPFIVILTVFSFKFASVFHSVPPKINITP